MTANQIAYRNYQEQVRSHMASENIARSELEEKRRSNLVSEAETYRSNLANEGIKQQQNTINQQHYERMDKETVRHDVQQEKVQFINAGVNVVDTLIQRSRELKIKQREADIKQKGVEVDQLNAETNQYKAATDRMNYFINAGELEVKRAQVGIAQGTLDLQKLTSTAQIYKDTTQGDLNKQKIVESNAKTHELNESASLKASQTANNWVNFVNNVINTIPRVTQIIKIK